MAPSEDNNRHEMPHRIEKILALTARHYKREGKEHLQRVLVNARYWIDEEWTYDNWDGGQWGHALHLELPLRLFEEIGPEKGRVEQVVCQDLNTFNDLPDEFLADLTIHVEDSPSLNTWREDSGLQIRHVPFAQASSGEDMNRIWDHPEHLRLFISHKASQKKVAFDLKQELAKYGISGFVAHADIEPAKTWQDEIEKALFSMEAVVALLSPDYHDSQWTDQEIGVAIGRGLTIISIRHGCDPYGFIGKYQAVSMASKGVPTLAQEICGLMLKDVQVQDRALEALTHAFEESLSFQQSKDIMDLLELTTKAPPEIVERLAEAPSRNIQISQAWGVQDRIDSLTRRLRGLGR